MAHLSHRSLSHFLSQYTAGEICVNGMQIAGFVDYWTAADELIMN